MPEASCIECRRPVYRRNQCNTHYHKLMRNPDRNLEPISGPPCKRCGGEVPVVRSKRAALCRSCRQEWRWCAECEAPWRTQGYEVKQAAFTLPCPMHVRDQQLRVRLGITLEHYSDLLRAQGSRCAVDGCDEREDLAVDHDHRCCPQRRACPKCIRGLVCARHNHALGKVRDSIADLEALAKYLVRYHASVSGSA